MNKVIWILWFQGFENAAWIVKQVAESWKINNPDWVIVYLTDTNIRNYLDDIDYMYDEKKTISMQAKSDIIRLSLLNRYGGIWADATMLCMRPLNQWIDNAIQPSGLWMYHGNGGDMIGYGPASWFIASEKGDNDKGYIISKWKEKCDEYWLNRIECHRYNWMDFLFRELYESDDKFRNLWNAVPNIYCEDFGQSHSLAHNSGMVSNYPDLKEIFEKSPPHALKFWKNWDDIFPDVTTEECINSNGYFAIQMSKRL
jgi:hypothetical protein